MIIEQYSSACCPFNQMCVLLPGNTPQVPPAQQYSFLPDGPWHTSSFSGHVPLTRISLSLASLASTTSYRTFSLFISSNCFYHLPDTRSHNHSEKSQLHGIHSFKTRAFETFTHHNSSTSRDFEFLDFRSFSAHQCLWFFII